MEVICDKYKLWLFNTFKKHKKIDDHIGKIAEFFYNDNEMTAKVCFISSLKDNGGLDCDTCINGILIDVDKKVNKILTDYTNQSSFGILGGNNDFMDLKKRQDIKFKCGECISDINELGNAYKIINES